jgi:hypothetical protein
MSISGGTTLTAKLSWVCETGVGDESHFQLARAKSFLTSVLELNSSICREVS